MQMSCRIVSLTNPFSNWVFKKIQTDYGADISLGDTVGDVFLGEDRSRCVIHMIQIQSHREDTIPVTSYLRPPQTVLPTTIDLAENKRLRDQETRYGATVRELNPNRPVQSAEPEVGPDEYHLDQEGFVIPKLPAKIRSVAKSRRQSSSFLVDDSQAGKPVHSETPGNALDNASSQHSYENHLFHSQLSETNGETSRLRIPSNPYASNATTPEALDTSQLPATPNVWPASIASEQIPETPEVDIAVSDPIEDEDEDEATPQLQPPVSKQASGLLRKRRHSQEEESDLSKPSNATLSRSKSLSTANVREQSKQNLHGKWSNQELDTLTTALAREEDSHDIHNTHFPTRTWESVRKKVRSFEKSHSAAIKARKKTVAIQAAQRGTPTKVVQAVDIKTPVAPTANVSSSPISATRGPETVSKRLKLTPAANISSSPITSTRGPETASKRQKSSPPLVKSSPATSIWSKQDDELFMQAIRDHQDWRTLRDRRFQNRSDDSFKQHFAEVRVLLEAKDAAAYAKKRTEELIRQGEPPSGPDEKYTQYEDDLLLAARLETAEIKRVAKDYFPLRTAEHVKTRATKLFQDARRKYSKQMSQSSTAASLSSSQGAELTHDQLLETLDPTTRQRIEAKRLQIQRDEKKFAADRTKEYQDSLKVSKDRARANGYREKTGNSEKMLMQLEETERKADSVRSRRLAEDRENERAYGIELAAWHKQAELDEASGKPIQPSPKRPLGSSIGTEVVAVQRDQTPGGRQTLSGITRVEADMKPSAPSGSQTSKLFDHRKDQDEGTKKILPIVEVRITPPKERKSEDAGTASAAQPTTSQKSRLGMVNNVTPSRKQGITNIAASQPVTRATAKTAHDAFISSPLRPRENTSSAQPVAKRTRQTTLPFSSRNGLASSLPERNPSIPCFSSRAKVADAVYISSDDTSSYSDSDINDEDLTELADKSSEMYPSSPPRGTYNEEVDSTIRRHQVHISSPDRPRQAYGKGTVIPSSQASHDGLDMSQMSQRPRLDREVRVGQLEHLDHQRVLVEEPRSILAQNASATQHGQRLLEESPVSTKEPFATGESEGGRGKKSLADRLRGVLRMDLPADLLSSINEGRIRIAGFLKDGHAQYESDSDVDVESDLEPDQLSNNDNPLPELGPMPPQGSVRAIEDDDVEDIDPHDVWRSPAHEDDDYGYGYDEDEDALDMEDAQEIARERGQFFQGAAPGTWNRESSPLVTTDLRRVNLPDSMTKKQKDMALAGPPRLSQVEQRARARTMPQTINSIKPQRGWHESSVQPSPPPFPSSGKVRSTPSTAQSESDDELFHANQDHGQDLRDVLPGFSSPTARNTFKRARIPEEAIPEPPKKRPRRGISQSRDRGNGLPRSDDRQRKGSTGSSNKSWRDQLLAGRRTAPPTVPAPFGKLSGKGKRKGKGDSPILSKKATPKPNSNTVSAAIGQNHPGQGDKERQGKNGVVEMVRSSRMDGLKSLTKRSGKLKAKPYAKK